jgi:hypothetical protein
MKKYCVLYVRDRVEHQSPWFSNAVRAHKALASLRSRYGAAVIYVD